VQQRYDEPRPRRALHGLTSAAGLLLNAKCGKLCGPLTSLTLSSSSLCTQVFDEMKYREMLDGQQDRWFSQGFNDEQVEVLTEREKVKLLNG
jgi:hypothetical protein|tara:strand:+ start:2047 stop:2322 length:276 start_codon:yes stop_codon:yes gene_type:complete